MKPAINSAERRDLSTEPRIQTEPRVAVAAFGLGFLLPLSTGGNVLWLLEPSDTLPVFLFASIAFAGLLLLRRVPRGRTTATETVSLLVLASWWCGNVLLRPAGPRAALEGQGLLAGTLLFLALSWRPLREEELARLVLGIAAGTFVTTLYGQYQYWIMFPKLAPKVAEIYGIGLFVSVNANFYNANSYAPFLAATILLLGGVASRNGYGWAMLFALVVTLFLAESRATLALLVVVAACLLGTKLDRRQLQWAIGGLVAAVVAFAFVGARWIDAPELWNIALPVRLDIWRGAAAMIRDHWAFGVGVGGFAANFEAYRVTDYYTRYPHNLLLEVFAELGVVGALSFVAFFVTAFVESYRSLRTGRSRLQAPALAAAVLLAAHALVDIDWHAPANPILLLMLLAVSRTPGASRAC